VAFLLKLQLLSPLQRYYIASSRELTRILSVQKSPVIHLFSESIAGAATIRGFGQEKRFMKRNLYLLDCFARPLFSSLAAIEWLCLRMELLSTFVFAFCMAILVSFPPGTIEPSMFMFHMLLQCSTMFGRFLQCLILCSRKPASSCLLKFIQHLNGFSNR
jgi:hypothetical protein